MGLLNLLLVTVALIFQAEEVLAAAAGEFHIGRLETVVHFAQYHRIENKFDVVPVPPEAVGVVGAVAAGGGAAAVVTAETSAGVIAAAAAAGVVLSPAIVIGGAVAGAGALGYIAMKYMGGQIKITGYEGCALLVETRDRISGSPAFCAQVLFRGNEGKKSSNYWRSVKGKVEIKLLKGQNYFNAVRNYPPPMAPDNPVGVFTLNEPTLNLQTIVGHDSHHIRDRWLRDNSYGHIILASPLSFRELYNRIDGMRQHLPGGARDFPFYYTVGGFSSEWSGYDAINCFGFCLRLASNLGIPINSNRFLREYLLMPGASRAVSKNRLERDPFLRELFTTVGSQRINGLLLSTTPPTPGRARNYWWRDTEEIGDARVRANEFLAAGHYRDYVPVPAGLFM